MYLSKNPACSQHFLINTMQVLGVKLSIYKALFIKTNTTAKDAQHGIK